MTAPAPTSPSQPIPLKIKLIDSSLPCPKFHSPQAAGLDLMARQDVRIPAGQVRLVPLNVILSPPSDYWVLLAARSSLHQKGLMMANGLGVGDPDFCGPEDEYRAVLLNFTDQEVVVKRGERVVQAILVKRDNVAIIQVAATTRSSSRGGIGSTG